MTYIRNPLKNSEVLKVLIRYSFLIYLLLSHDLKEIFQTRFYANFHSSPLTLLHKANKDCLSLSFSGCSAVHLWDITSRLASLIWISHLCWKWESKLICFLHLISTVSELIFTIWWRNELDIFLWLWLSWAHYCLFQLVCMKSKHWENPVMSVTYILSFNHQQTSVGQVTDTYQWKSSHHVGSIGKVVHINLNFYGRTLCLLFLNIELKTNKKRKIFSLKSSYWRTTVTVKILKVCKNTWCLNTFFCFYF